MEIRAQKTKETEEKSGGRKGENGKYEGEIMGKMRLTKGGKVGNGGKKKKAKQKEGNGINWEKVVNNMGKSG